MKGKYSHREPQAMETQNITPIDVPHPQDVARIFMQYLNAAIEVYPNYRPALLGVFLANSGMWLAQYTLTMSATGVELRHTCLVLNPLSKISNDHCQAIYRILHKTDYPATNRPDLDMIDLRDYIEAYLADEIRQDVADQLREWGYALPYKQWSVEQLVALGIYKLV